MRTVDSLRALADRHRVATEIGVAIGTLALVVVVSIVQWGATEDGLLRGVALGATLAVIVSIVMDRRRRITERFEREAAAQRLQIARELHDTVAGAVSVIGIQAAAARRVLDTRPADAAVALERIEAASRSANADLRRMLDALRDDGPTPTQPEAGLDHLERLVEEVGSSGPQVRLDVDPAALDLADPALDHAAYRIVQEALTNVVRHAGAASVAVDVRVRQRSLELSVVNGPGRDRSDRGTSGPRLGILGMRERAALFGGELAAEPTPDGGFAVHASLPIPASAAARSGSVADPASSVGPAPSQHRPAAGR